MGCQRMGGSDSRRKRRVVRVSDLAAHASRPRRGASGLLMMGDRERVAAVSAIRRVCSTLRAGLDDAAVDAVRRGQVREIESPDAFPDLRNVPEAF